MKSIDQTKAETFAGWLKKIVINQAIDQLRKEKTYKDTVVLEQTHKRTNADQNTAIQSLVTKDLLLLIERLSSPSKEVFKLNILDGYKHKEITKILSIGESKSKWHLAKARRELKESYIKIYGK